MIQFTVTKVRSHGIASAGVLGAPIFSHLLLLMIGALTLSMPVVISFELSRLRELDLPQAKETAASAVGTNPGAYTGPLAAEILKRIARAQSFEQLVAAFGFD